VTIEHSFAAQQSVWCYLHANAYARSCSHGSSTATTPDTREKFTIAISREAGIDAGAYARAIGEQLGWPVWDHELLELIANRLGSNVSALESLDERHISWIQESMEAFLQLHSVNQHAFVRHLRESMADLAARGSCIIVGRGAPHILPSKTTLKVRLVAPLELRVAVFRKQMGIDDAGRAARELEKIDRERIRFVSEHFHKDSLDPAAYDVVLNISHFSEADCARILQDFLQAIAN
jgi:cytidylate kinase